MGIAPEKIVALPTPEKAEHSLLASAINPQGDARPDNWQVGLTAKAEFCGQASAWDPCSTGADRKKVDPGENPDAFDYSPFMLEVPFQCSSFGWQAADYQGRAERFIKAATPKALEREFWTGEKIPSNQSLVGGTPNDDDHVLNPGGASAPVAVSPIMGLILAGAALSNCSTGGKGMIHVPAETGEALYQAYSFDEDDQQNLVTGARGDIIVVGAGYPGTGPEGQPAPTGTQQWIYATGMVSVLIDDAVVHPQELHEALDRATNTVVFRGERTAAAYHDGCCSFAVLVDYSLSGASSDTGDTTVECPADPFPALDNSVISGTLFLSGEGNFMAMGLFDATTGDPPTLPEGVTASSSFQTFDCDGPIPTPGGSGWLPWNFPGTDPRQLRVPIPAPGGFVEPGQGVAFSVVLTSGLCTVVIASAVCPVPASVDSEDAPDSEFRVWSGSAWVPAGAWSQASLPTGGLWWNPIPASVIVGFTQECITTRATVVTPCGGAMPVTFDLGGDPMPVEIAAPDPLPVEVAAPNTIELDAGITMISDGSSQSFGSFRSLTVTVIEGTATIQGNGSASGVPAGVSLTWSVDHPGDVFLTEIQVHADADSRVIVTTTYPD